MNIHDWFVYHFSIGSIPMSQGSMEKADFICPQAFGRNTWFDAQMPKAMSKLRWSVALNLENHQDEAIRELADMNFDPGLVNDSLANGCYIMAKQMQALGKEPWIIGQWEVIFALATANEEMAGWYQNNKQHVISIWPPISGNYLGTRGMLFEAKEIAKKLLLRSPVIIAHREHLARCAYLAEDVFGKSNVILPERLFPLDDEVRFDPDSKQEQTRNVNAWRRYEFLVRFHHMLHGWTK